MFTITLDLDKVNHPFSSPTTFHVCGLDPETEGDPAETFATLEDRVRAALADEGLTPCSVCDRWFPFGPDEKFLYRVIGDIAGSHPEYPTVVCHDCRVSCPTVQTDGFYE